MYFLFGNEFSFGLLFLLAARSISEIYFGQMFCFSYELSFGRLHSFSHVSSFVMSFTFDRVLILVICLHFVLVLIMYFLFLMLFSVFLRAGRVFSFGGVFYFSGF
jgi:hypothetical protein